MHGSFFNRVTNTPPPFALIQFHPGSPSQSSTPLIPNPSPNHGCEILLNAVGTASWRPLLPAAQPLPIRPSSISARWCSIPTALSRTPGQRHQYWLLWVDQDWLRQFTPVQQDRLHPFWNLGSSTPLAPHLPAGLGPLEQQDRDFARSLAHPPVIAELCPIWLQAQVTLFLTRLMSRCPVAPHQAPSSERQHQVVAQRLEKAVAYLEAHLDEPLDLPSLARHVGCSHFYLSRLFSEHKGQTLRQYLRALRIDRAAALLSTGRYNVTEAAVEVGYRSLSHFTKAFLSKKGCLPRDFHG